jgi:hypothetical protein
MRTRERSCDVEAQAMDQMLEAALDYARRGWFVLPVHGISNGVCMCAEGAACPSPGKHPLVMDWPRAATTNENQIRAWMHTWPTANIGILTGKASGVVGLDVDRRSGGLDALEALQTQHGPLPPTLVAHTGGGGRHYLFRYPEGGVRSTTICPGVEVKSDGMFIVVAPSRHASGRTYMWEDGFDVDG